MRIPLRFQITEFDCGTIALQNAVCYLYERETIPADIIRAIHNYTLDCYEADGKLNQAGVSGNAIDLMTTWFESFAKRNIFDLRCERYLGKRVDMSIIRTCLANHGAVLIKTNQRHKQHFVIATKIDTEYIYLWDSYFLDEDYYDPDKEVTIIFDKPFDYNRKVSLRRFDSEIKKDFSLGTLEERECVLFYKKTI